ncbi:hypothetical protein [Gryllotalpicola kribbensis]
MPSAPTVAAARASEFLVMLRFDRGEDRFSDNLPLIDASLRIMADA